MRPKIKRTLELLYAKLDNTTNPTARMELYTYIELLESLLDDTYEDFVEEL